MTKTPVDCSYDQGKLGCQLIATHILELAETSHAQLLTLTPKGSSPGVLRSVYVLNLIAYEETGKLFKMWQTLADWEKAGKKEAIIHFDQLEDHPSKGNIFGELCSRMMDFAESMMDVICKAINEDPAMTGTPEAAAVWLEICSVLRNAYSLHRDRIQVIGENFKDEREAAMNVDWRVDHWVSPKPQAYEMLLLDCFLLETISRAAKAYLAGGLNLQIAVKALSDMSQEVVSEDTKTFMAVLQKHDPEKFGFSED